MFKWLYRFFRRNKNNCMYVSCNTPSPTPAATSYCIKPQNVLKTSCSTANVCCSSNNCNGYKVSPYSKDFVKPEKHNHAYKPIETTMCCTNTCCVQPTPKPEPTPETQPPKPTSCYTPTATTNEFCQIDFYETVKITNPTCAPVVTPTFESTCNTPIVTPTYEPCAPSVPQTVESEAPEPILPKEGCIFAMNGYGVNVEVDNKKIVAYIDMGIDVNITPGQKVLLHHRKGNYDKKVGKVISETGTERKGHSEEILVQELLDV